MDPRGNVLGHSDVLCANRSAMVRLTRLSRAWRAQAHCFHALCVLRCQGHGGAYDLLRSLRTSAHTGVAIRAPSTMLVDRVLTKGERIATPGDVGHWLAMTEKNPTLRNHPTADYTLRWLFFKCQRFRRSACTPRALPSVMLKASPSGRSTHESGGSSAFGNEIAEKRWCLAFRRSRAKRTPPVRRRAGLNRVNCITAKWARLPS